ncbi:MAG: hypothetical protein AAFR47_24380, partial [Pseudomonadota bacterium]
MSTPSDAYAPPARIRLGRPRAGQAAAVLLVLAAAIAAAEPLRWLVVTWTDPSYGSDGWVVALAITVLAVRSALSPRRARSACRRWWCS